MAAPTLVASYIADLWTNSTSPRSTASFSRSVNDVLIAVVGVEDATAINFPPGDVTGVTWSNPQTVTTALRCHLAVYTAVVSQAGTGTITFTESSATTLDWGARVYHWSNSAGVGTSNKGDAADSAASVTLTGVLANSAIVMILADYEAGNPTLTYRTADAGAFTEVDHVDDGNLYTVYTGYHADTGSAANKVVGFSAPTTPDWSLIAVEVKGSATTAVGKDLQTIWDVRAPIGDTVQAIWDVRAAVGDPLQLVWDVRSAIGDPLDLLWDVRAAVGDPLQLVWDTRQAIADTLQLIWNVESALSTVGKDLGLVWDVRAAVADLLQLAWDTRAPVGKDNQLVWDVRAAVGDTVQVVWDVRSTVGDTVELQWTIRTPVGKDGQLVWDVRQAIGDVLQLIWNVESNAAVAGLLGNVHGPPSGGVGSIVHTTPALIGSVS